MSIGLGFALLAAGAGPAVGARLKPRWRQVADTTQGGVLVGSRYVFEGNPADSEGRSAPGGTLIDDQTGRQWSIVPPGDSSSDCRPSAIGGAWLAYNCSSPTGSPPGPVELYEISTRQWRVMPEAVSGRVLAIGADWFEIAASQPGGPQPQFVFQNIETGQSRSLPGWQPGGRTVPNLNSPSLGQTLCAPIRVPDGWQGNGLDWPGTVNFFGHNVIVGGTNRQLTDFGYLERCGTHTRRPIGPLGPLTIADGSSANAQAAVWQPSPTASDLQGVYLPSLKKFTIDTTALVNSVTSSYYGERSTYFSWLTARSLYVLVEPGYPQDCTPDPCYPDPSQLYSAPAPRQPKRHQRRR